jgi:hypothetical protein
VLGGTGAVLADGGISDDVVVVVSVVEVVVPVEASVDVVLSVVDSVVDSESCAQAASVSDAVTMAAAVRLRSVAFMGSSSVSLFVVDRPSWIGRPQGTGRCDAVAKRASLRAPIPFGRSVDQPPESDLAAPPFSLVSR